MHRDKKLGLALGILLVGIVAAFFFRNEPRPVADLPRLQDALALDEAIREKPIAPYVAEGSAVEADAAADPLAALEAGAAELNEPVASLIDDDWGFLQEGDADDPLAAADPGPPAPIGYREATSSMAAADPELNDLNAGWEIAADAVTGAAAERAADARSDSSRNRRSPVAGVSGTQSSTRRGRQAGDSAFQQTSGRAADITDRYSRGAGSRSAARDSKDTVERSTGFAEKTPSRTASAGVTGSRETGRRTFRVKEYRVQSGDTLTGLSSRFLGTHKRYRELYEANRDRLKDVDDLRVGMLIRIPEAGSRGQTGLAHSQRPAPKTAAEAVADNRGNGTPTDAAVKSSRPVSPFDDIDIDESLSGSAGENSRPAAPPAADNPFAGSEPPAPESFAGSGSNGTAKPSATTPPADAIAETDVTGTTTGRQPSVAPIRPVSQGRTRAGAQSTAGSATGNSSVDGRAESGTARPRTAAAGKRTPENPYGLYLIEQVDDAVPAAGPARPATNDWRTSPAAAPQRKFVPAGTLPGSRTRYTGPSPEGDNRTSESVPRSTQPPATSANERAEPRMWTVRRGDTLEGIAVRVYGRRSATSEIFAANRDRLKNPNLLRVGTKIRLPELSR